MSTKTTKPWFEVDKDGLAKLFGAKPKSFLLYELVQNAWDEGARSVDAWLRSNGVVAELIVVDGVPDGFKNLTHAFTLFAESAKKSNPELRGRFNLGEKLVLALCDKARIRSTTGTIEFTPKGRIHRPELQLSAGTRFEATLQITVTEAEAAVRDALRMIPPPGVHTAINGQALPQRNPLRSFQAVLPTETTLAADAGVIRRTERQTTVEIYATPEGKSALLLELGIPVVETDLPWDVNVLQKVPLTLDRTNVPPSYLRKLSAACLANASDLLLSEQTSAPWVSEAIEDPHLPPETVQTVVRQRFGPKAVIYDPSDPEGTKLAVSQGYTVVHGGTFSGPAWQTIKNAGALLPAGQVTPSPKPFSPDGDPLRLLPEEKWAPAIRATAAYCREIARGLLGAEIEINITPDVTWHAAACYGNRSLTLNLGRLGKKWFDDVGSEAMLSLLIHEFAHHFALDHLSAEYHEALADLGAKLARLAVDRPDIVVPDSTMAPSCLS